MYRLWANLLDIFHSWCWERLFSTSVIFHITFIYVMRNTAVFFCTRIVQSRFREPFVLLPFFTFEWTPEWESPDLMFHRTVLLFFGVFIIAWFFANVNMANCKKCAFNFCRKSRNCNKWLIFLIFPLYKWQKVWYNKTVVGQTETCGSPFCLQSFCFWSFF